MDYEHLARLHYAVVASELLDSAADGRARVHTRSRFCVLVFCFDVMQVTDYALEGNGDLVAVAVPAQSDLRYGRYRWEFREDGPGRTQLHFHAEVEPDFWVPPLIGPWILGRKLQDLAVGVARSLALYGAEAGR